MGGLRCGVRTRRHASDGPIASKCGQGGKPKPKKAKYQTPIQNQRCNEHTGGSFTFTRASKIIDLAAEGQRGPAKPRSAASTAAAGAGDATEWPACVTSGAVDVRLTSIMNGAMRSSFHWSTQHVRWSWITARAAARVGTQQSTCRQCGLVRLRLPTPRSDYLHSLSPLLTLKALVREGVERAACCVAVGNAVLV